MARAQKITFGWEEFIGGGGQTLGMQQAKRRESFLVAEATFLRGKAVFRRRIEAGSDGKLESAESKHARASAWPRLSAVRRPVRMKDVSVLSQGREIFLDASEPRLVLGNVPATDSTPLRIEVFATRTAGAEAAARAPAAGLRECLRRRGEARIMVGTGNSQLELIRALARQPGINWGQVDAFHLDEYVGLAADHPSSFRHWIRHRRSGSSAVRQLY
jgi:hypothetical protein